MKFLLDQDVYALTAKVLSELEHDVVTATDLGLSRASDEQILEAARTQERIFVTRDRDYGNLVFVKGIEKGVIYLRGLPSDLESIHQVLKKVLGKYSENELAKLFIVVEKNRHRVRKIA